MMSYDEFVATGLILSGAAFVATLGAVVGNIIGHAVVKREKRKTND